LPLFYSKYADQNLLKNKNFVFFVLSNTDNIEINFEKYRS
jgi:hypothetical protein